MEREGGGRYFVQIAQEIAKRQVSKDNKTGDIKDNKHASTVPKRCDEEDPNSTRLQVMGDSMPDINGKMEDE